MTDHDDAGEAPILPLLRRGLLDLLEDRSPPHDGTWLRYGSDLSPEACERRIWSRLNKLPEDAKGLGDEIRFEGGRHFEGLVLDALERAGFAVARQVEARPRRPSAWAFAPGHADGVVTAPDGQRVLVEVKAPSSAVMASALGNPRKLVRESYRWQLSAYWHALAELEEVERASWLFVDREGAHEPVEVPLEGDLIVPLEKIVAQEVERSRLFGLAAAPDRIAGTTVVRAWKGRGKKPERILKAFALPAWQCGFCPYVESCKPGEDETEIELPGETRERVLARAEKTWADATKAGKKVAAPLVVKLRADGSIDEGAETDEAEAPLFPPVEDVPAPPPTLAEVIAVDPRANGPIPGDPGAILFESKNGALVPIKDEPETAPVVAPVVVPAKAVAWVAADGVEVIDW